MQPKYKRILLKLSGEALAGDQRFGLNHEVIAPVVDQIIKIHNMGVQVGLVIGGGNFWRGRQGTKMDRTTADQMGMLATVMNSLAMMDAIEQHGVPVRVQTALDMVSLAEPFILRKALRHFEQGRIVIFACGTGNDFLRDVEHDNGLISLTPYLENLPTVSVQGKEYRFLNGVGYGIDGYCCEVGDKLRMQKPGEAINYTGIAIKGLLFHYKPVSATVIVDGKEYRFKKVWLAPTMNGRFYGGGMLPAPEQRREQPTVSVMVFHGTGKIKSLLLFPSIFKGEHVKKAKHISVLSGNEITVRYDEPRALQIDGETIVNVSQYTVKK